jgi:hypothetical protein
MRLENEPASSGTPGSEGVTNEEQRAYWNGEEAEHQLQYEDRYEEMLRPYTRRLLDVVRLDQADVVLDVGCGCSTAPTRPRWRRWLTAVAEAPRDHESPEGIRLGRARGCSAVAGRRSGHRR